MFVRDSHHEICLQIDYGEYTAMLWKMQITGDDTARVEAVARARAQAHFTPWVPSNTDLGKELGPVIAEMLKMGDPDPKTVRDVLKKLFDTADVDKSLFLDTNELAEVMKAYYKLEGVARSRSVVIREVEAAMKKYDIDRSGTLEFPEFVNMFCDSSKDAVFQLKLPAECRRQIYLLTNHEA